MTPEEEQLMQEKFAHVRRIKRILRPLPRRATVHRYPLIGYFASTARKRSYLWSFRMTHVIPALYVGSVIAFLPIYGIQIALAFIFSLLLRANLPLFVGLQLITNPLTAFPIYWTEFQIGRHFLGLFGGKTEELGMAELKTVLDDFFHGNWGDNLHYLSSVFGLTSLGGVIVGVFVGTILVWIYRVTMERMRVTFKRLRELQKLREKRDRRLARKKNRPKTRLFRRYRNKRKRK